MYLISVEGGDGSGKGEAVRILATLANRLAFPNVHVTHEPRRHSDLGKLALKAVSKGEHTPLQEAGLFAADRVDHSHTWIRPRLLKGDLVISDRNIHSSLVYQGVVGKLGLKQVAKMNAAAMIPDLVIWIDCDPAKAMKRINSGTLRMAGEKHEYFETTEIQTKIRAGFRGILSGEIETPAPFSRSIIIGPVLNEGGLDDLERQLSQALSTFFNRRLEPLNVNRDEVDRHLLKSLTTGVQTQQKLPGAPSQHISLLEDWLDGKSPAQWMQLAEDEWDEKRARASDVPGRPIAHSSWAILGTLSLTDTTDVPSLHRQLGPVRSVTKRHTQRLVKWMEQERWIHRQQSHVPFAEAQMFKLRKSRLGYGRLCLAMWPLRVALASWRRSNPESDWANALSEIIQSTEEKKVPLQIRNAVKHVIERLNLISSGHAECPVPQNEEELVIWWSIEPPK
ncbi:MAG: dTMP kinase [Euryarchaeota archaeon TMED279]|nr:dTMP kinase [Euryarchaeota archaeon]OUX47364.1 MAG: dTMP kinase [Euryarchaeota archaeon TMED279]